MFSDTSRVMFIKSPAAMMNLNYYCTGSDLGMFLSIVMFEEVRFVWFTVRLFPARSNAVMLNQLDHQRDLHLLLHLTCR